MKTSKIITLLLILLIFSFICDIESRITERIEYWSSEIELDSRFHFNLPTPDIGKVSTLIQFLK